MNVPPYPSEYALVPRRRRPWRAWLLLLAVAAAILLALAYPPRVDPHPEHLGQAAAVLTHKPSAHPAPAKSAVTVAVGKAVYSCVPATPKPAPKPKR